eukprot:143837_1
MFRLNHILSHLTSYVSSSIEQRKCGGQTEITSLDVFEFMNAILNGGRGGGVNEIALADKVKLRRVFDKMDLDSSGDLDREEFGKAARLCSMIITEDEINDIFSKMDLDNNGTIDFNEFRDAIDSLLTSFKVSPQKFMKLPKEKKL